jgi:hypothetical protein
LPRPRAAALAEARNAPPQRRVGRRSLAIEIVTEADQEAPIAGARREAVIKAATETAHSSGGEMARKAAIAIVANVQVSGNVETATATANVSATAIANADVSVTATVNRVLSFAIVVAAW